MADAEDSLMSDIKEYERQLLELRLAVEASNDTQEKEELLKLSNDMDQLISLSKDALLTMKKERLFKEVDRLAGIETNNISNSKCNSSLSNNGQLDEVVTINVDRVEDNDANASDLKTLFNSLEGTRCQAPFTFEWRNLGYHNAIVVNVEPHDSIESMDDVKVKVMFCNPTVNAMKPCSFFLDGNCRFTDSQCRFSHGLIVPFRMLREFSEPDYSLLQRDALCLAKYTDGLWYPAVVESVSDDDHKVVVNYKCYKNEATLELEDVIPQEILETSSSSSSSDSETEDETSTLQIPVIALVPVPDDFGQWERHTRGIGSKLMAKMGYVWGMGLGKNGEGRMEPVEAVVVPHGKSLDQIMILREKRPLADPRSGKKKTKRKAKRKGSVQASFNWLMPLKSKALANKVEDRSLWKVFSNDFSKDKKKTTYDKGGPSISFFGI